MNFKEEVLNILTERPEELPLLIANTGNKKFLMRTLYQYMPYKTGVEIEANGSLSMLSKTDSYILTKQLGCLQYHDDYSNLNGGSDVYARGNIAEFCEHRICFDGWKQAIALKRLCLLLQEHCAINPGGAIHFHINFPEIRNMYGNRAGMDIARKVLNVMNNNKPIHAELCALSERNKYTLRAEIEDKGFVFNLRNQGTIEFRTSKCSFDYKHISTKITQIHKVVRKIRAIAGLEVNLREG